MIDKAHRFQGYNSLRFVYQKGQTVRGPLCALKYALNRRRSTYRIAIVVSRKVHKSAVVRNRIRRRMYEVIRAYGPRIKDSYDLVFMVYSEQLAELPLPELQTAVREKLEKAHILGKTALDPQDRGIVDLKENLGK
ncbi:MAG TPA: ribonuclease P protein component [Candidatus Saccharimonadales bacterium]